MISSTSSNLSFNSSIHLLNSKVKNSDVIFISFLIEFFKFVMSSFEGCKSTNLIML